MNGVAKGRAFTRLLVTTVALAFAGDQALALNAQIFQPLPSQLGVATVQGSQPLAWRSSEIGFMANLDMNPLEFGDNDDDRVDDLVNWVGTVNLLAAWWVLPKVSLYLDMPLHLVTNVEPIGSGDELTALRPGDLRLGALWQLVEWQLTESAKLGVAVSPFIEIPTGSVERFTGNGAVSGGGKLVVDSWLTHFDYLALNGGVRWRPQEVILNLNVDDELLASMAYQRRLWRDVNQFVFAEFTASTTLRDAFADEETAPLELLLGYKGILGQNWSVTGGLGRGASNGYGAPDMRLFGGLSYRFAAKVRPEPTPEPEAKPTPAPEPEPKAAVIGNHIVIAPIFFDIDKDRLKAISFPVLDEVAEILLAQPGIERLEISGHTDGQGHREHNLDLSHRRAKTVRDYLIDHGVKPDRLKTIGYGPDQPIDSNETVEGRAKNRRVEFEIMPILTSPKE